MYLADFHTHSQISFDSTAPLDDMALAAVGEGLAELCVTDHCDLLDEYGLNVYEFDWYGALAQYRASVPVYAHCLKLKLGLELGMGHIDPETSRKILDVPELDFVIGSIHNLSPQAGGSDFFYRDHSKASTCYNTLDNYFASMAELAVTDFYDVLGHIIYPLRYIHRDGLDLTLADYEERVRAIFTEVAKTDHAMEVNVCRGKDIAPWPPLLRWFRECGGRLVTVGSDAHRPEDVAKGIPQALDMVRAAGFDGVATFAGRKPILHKF